MTQDESSWISPNQLMLAVVKYPQIKEKYVKKLEYLMQKDGQRDPKKRTRIEELLSKFAYEVIQLENDFLEDDQKPAPEKEKEITDIEPSEEK